MSATRHLIFDFFGTLVTYPNSFVGLQKHQHSYGLLRQAGLGLSYDDFIAFFVATRQQLEAWGRVNLREYSMTELVDQFCDQYMPVNAHSAVRQEFLDAYLAEWSTSVHHCQHVTEMLRRLAEHYSLSVISNCHHKPLVMQHLERLGVVPLLEDVLTSVETGYRKPHPDIFNTALNRLGLRAEECLFIGDSYLPDYLGPSDAGITSWLIDPECRHNIPDEHRLMSVLDAETRLISQTLETRSFLTKAP